MAEFSGSTSTCLSRQRFTLPCSAEKMLSGVNLICAVATCYSHLQNATHSGLLKLTIARKRVAPAFKRAWLNERVAVARILLVEDDPDLLFLLEHILRVEGHSINAVRTVSDALSLLECGFYDLAITD